MKKIITITLVLATLLSLAVPAYAYDGITTTTSWTSWWDWWHNFVPGDSATPTDPSEPTVPTEPEAVELGVTTITEARFYHSASVASLRNRLQISWEEVENATGYEIEVTKADGEILTYTSTSATLMVKNSKCPKVYVEDTSTWTAAVVRVRAVTDDALGDWSEGKKIGCDMIH